MKEEVFVSKVTLNEKNEIQRIKFSGKILEASGIVKTSGELIEDSEVLNDANTACLNEKIYRIIETEKNTFLEKLDIPLYITKAELNQNNDISRIKLSGNLLSSIFPDLPENEKKVQGIEKFFKVTETKRNTYLEKMEIPYYYLQGFHKKIDISKMTGDSFPEFADEVIQSKRTFLRHDRLYTLWQAVKNVRHLRSPILEVGICRGGSLKLMLHAQRFFKKRGRIYGADTFTGHAFVHPEMDGNHQVGGFSEFVNYDDIRKYFSKYREIILKKGPIEETYSSIREEKFSLIHLDVDVYPSTKFCLEVFSDKLELGGLIIVDDYGFTTCPGVSSAVQESLQKRQDFSVMYLLTGQLVLQKIRKESFLARMRKIFKKNA